MAKVRSKTKILPSQANIGAKANLEKLLQLEKPIALVGAGLSVGAGMPSWAKLLEGMDRKLGRLSNEYMDLLRQDPDLLWRAEEYRHLMDDTAFFKMMQKQFGAKVKLPDGDPSLTFVRLPFRHFLTTNYDDVLIAAHEKNGIPAPRRLNWFMDSDVRTFVYNLRSSSRVRNILHLHGHHSAPESIILSDSDYTNRYAAKFGTAAKLFAIFATERVVFAGFSMNDQYLQSMLRDVNATMGQTEGARHFAILGLDRPKAEVLERSRYLKRYSVEPVFYDSSGNRHDGLLEILNDLELATKRSFSEGRQYDVLPEDRLSSGGSVAATEVLYPDDPEKGRWGGRPESNGRKLTAKVKQIEVDWFEVTMKVEATATSKPLGGDVIFHLHPTFVPSVRVVQPSDPKTAILKVQSYGAYTVGVELDNGRTHLELDLAELKGAPAMFRLN